MTEEIIGSTREIAAQLAMQNGFPLARWSLEELPTVMQYLAVNQNLRFARRELSNLMRDRLLARFGNRLPEDLDRDDLNSVVSATGKMLRATRRLEAHRVLASKPFITYITVNSDEMMEDALREAGREPRSDFSRWNDKIADVSRFPTLRESEPRYTPNKDQPLVYHVYGKLSVPESLVITEDDYFDYLLRIGSKADGKNLAPGAVGTALTADALLFIGFRLEDWPFRVLLRSIYSKQGSGAREIGQDSLPCVGAQLIPEKGRMIEPEGTRKYFEKYLRSSNIDIFWGRVDDFVRELDRHDCRDEGRGEGVMNRNPYVGPRSIGGVDHPNEKIYGREREIADLMDLLIADRVVLLYSPSGAGKSSLLQAGLVPAMEGAASAYVR